jgi:hypothetical protein
VFLFGQTTVEIHARGVQFNAKAVDQQEVTEILLTALSYEPPQGARIRSRGKASRHRTRIEHILKPSSSSRHVEAFIRSDFNRYVTTVSREWGFFGPS